MRVLGLIALEVALSALGAVIIFAPARYSVGSDRIWGWICLVMFGSIAATSIWRFFMLPIDGVVLSPEGLRVTRFGPNLIPWSAVMSVGERRNRSGTIVTLHLSPEGLQRIRRPLILSFLHSVDRLLGVTYVMLPHIASDVASLELQRLLGAYARAYGSSAASKS